MKMTEIEAVANAKEADNALQNFLEEKKGKKSPSKTDAAQFEALWLAFADAQGLTAAMPLLCQGFAFAAADPLYAHMRQKGTSANGYSLIGTYSCVRESKHEMELRIYLSLLANELRDTTSTEAVDGLLKRIVATSYNKEGKISGNLGSYVRKLLISPLCGRQIAEAASCGLAPSEIRPFLKVIGPIVRSLLEGDSLSAKEKTAASELDAWMSALIKGEPNLACEDVSGGLKDADKPIANEVGCQIPAQQPIGIDEVVGFIQSQQKKIDVLKASLVASESECARMREDKARLNQQIERLNESLENAKAHAGETKSQLDAAEKRAGALEKDLAAAKEYASLVDKSIAKESDEVIMRISRKLKIEYQDFLDALNLDMDADLGENMRLQLQSVFKILKDNGFEL